ncbi:MAG: RluA family pseudouridine synthase [Spirochaetaceae bacterium]|nr:RluA family pseudouridine synthase [Spirochaetaceae bacterium]
MNREKYKEFTAGSNDDGKRLDRIIRQFMPENSLSGLYKALRKGLIRINDNKAKPESKISQGDTLQIFNSLLQEQDLKEKPAKPVEQSFTDQIIYEDENLLALNKKKGQLVHGGRDSLEEMVRRYLEGKIPQSLSFRPGPLHRLDRNTSGLIFFSKSIKGAREFSSDLQSKKFIKYYIALMDGTLKGTEFWVDNLQREEKKKVTTVEYEGQIARSTAYPIHNYRGYSLALIKIETGRTHQIRAQASFHKYPLSGDTKYGGSFLKTGYFLHSLTFKNLAGDSHIIKEEIKASLDKAQLKQLNRVLSDCTIEDLEAVITALLEDQ